MVDFPQIKNLISYCCVDYFTVFIVCTKLVMDCINQEPFIIWLKNYLDLKTWLT